MRSGGWSTSEASALGDGDPLTERVRNERLPRFEAHISSVLDRFLGAVRELQAWPGRVIDTR